MILNQKKIKGYRKSHEKNRLKPSITKIENMYYIVLKQVSSFSAQRCNYVIALQNFNIQIC